MQHSQFTVAGMSTSTSSPNLNTWGSTSTGGPLGASTFGDHSLSQSRSHYQSGYLMSSTQDNNVPQGSQRVDEVPIVQTKAKLNHIASRGSAADFGMDSMFQSSRQRQTFADEDAPPTTSINDMMNETPDHFQPRREKPTYGASSRQAPLATPNPSQRPEPLYVIVFGYPLDKYSVTLQFFRSMGETTEPDINTEIVNCFKLGYYDHGEGMRAQRKNGEVINGSFMVGVKYADQVQAERLLGKLAAQAPHTSSVSQNNFTSPPPPTDGSAAMAVDEPQTPATRAPGGSPILGTPLKLAPSMAAFRRGGPGSKPATPQQAGWSGGLLSASVSAPVVQPSPSKGVMGQVSDLIFGW